MQMNHREQSAGQPHPNEDPMEALQRRMMEKRKDDRVRASMERNQANDEIELEIKVLPIKKKVHAQNPGSSPE